jgi:hypothetical protein
MSERDLDQLYRRASGKDPARPGASVRQAILDEAHQLATRTDARQSRWLARLSRVHWQIAAPLAAAVLAAIVLAPQLRSSLRPNGKQPPAPRMTAMSDTRPVRPLPAPLARTAPLVAAARLAPKAFPATAEASRSNVDRESGAPSPLPSPTPSTAANRAPSAELAPSQDATARLQASPAPAAAPAAPLHTRSVQSKRASTPEPSADGPLQQAAARGDVASVRSLLQQSTVSINERDRLGRTALLLAVMNDQEAVVRALLERGADPNLSDAEGRTPLAIARERNDTRMVETLRQAGAR